MVLGMTIYILRSISLKLNLSQSREYTAVELMELYSVSMFFVQTVLCSNGRLASP